MNGCSSSDKARPAIKSIPVFLSFLELEPVSTKRQSPLLLYQAMDGAKYLGDTLHFVYDYGLPVWLRVDHVSDPFRTGLIEA